MLCIPLARAKGASCILIFVNKRRRLAIPWSALLAKQKGFETRLGSQIDDCFIHSMACSTSKPVATESISFAEIIKDRDSTVRMTPDRMLYAVELAMVETGKDKIYSGQV
jgi:hypothetical protein